MMWFLRVLSPPVLSRAANGVFGRTFETPIAKTSMHGELNVVWLAEGHHDTKHAPKETTCVYGQLLHYLACYAAHSTKRV